MSRASWLATATMLTVAVANRSAAQSIAGRVDAVRDGTVGMTFPTRPGVCGDGRGSIWTTHGDGVWVSGSYTHNCVAGPVRVTMSRSRGETVTIRKCVACFDRELAKPDVDLGDVSPSEAAKYLLGAARSTSRKNADEAISAAVFADAGNITPDLARLVRDEDTMTETRKQALFWLGQSDDEATGDLIKVYETLRPQELRNHFTFVLSQRRDDQSVDKLIDIARSDSDVKVRKQALFWLGQSKDPKAIKFFRDVLTR